MGERSGRRVGNGAECPAQVRVERGEGCGLTGLARPGTWRVGSGRSGTPFEPPIPPWNIRISMTRLCLSLNCDSATSSAPCSSLKRTSMLAVRATDHRAGEAPTAGRLRLVAATATAASGRIASRRRSAPTAPGGTFCLPRSPAGTSRSARDAPLRVDAAMATTVGPSGRLLVFPTRAPGPSMKTVISW